MRIFPSVDGLSEAGRTPEADHKGVGYFQSTFDFMVPFEIIVDRYSEILLFVNRVTAGTRQMDCERAVFMIEDYENGFVKNKGHFVVSSLLEAIAQCMLK